ncbi:HAMP domain-containing sensor histidine kinase [Sorangium sp. So ce388]|uniref:sensor histidine kinase n=1 Tax=Sorangium sp. So ce388 TaxID=3133309 RepID=UPI003F5B1FAB
MADARRSRRAGTLARAGSLRVRLTVAVAVLSGAGLTLGGALLVRAVEATVLRAVEDANRAELEDLRAQIELGVPVDVLKLEAPPPRFIRVFRQDGTEVIRETAAECPPPPAFGFGLAPMDPPALPDIPPGPPRPVPPGPGRRAPPWSVVEMPIVSPADGPLTAIAMSPLDDVLRSTRTLTRVLAVGIPALVILLTAAAWVLIGRTLRPVRAMTLRAAGIADATTGERLAVPPTFDEVAELGRTLNGMLDRLADGARRQREFVSDASHELRSPIAAVRASLEVALAHPDRADTPAVQRGVLAEILRLEALVADLLALARLDEQRAPPHDEIDLDDVVLEEAARARAVPVDTRGVSAAKVRGDRRGLEHLVRNLLDNAARYAASRVIVTTEVDEREVVLRVDDDGPGIPEQDRARVFGRFTRVASSRSRDAGGAGLGLALVQRITDQHGGAVRAGRSPQGGARLEVRLPALAAFCGSTSAELGSA